MKAFLYQVRDAMEAKKGGNNNGYISYVKLRWGIWYELKDYTSPVMAFTPFNRGDILMANVIVN